MVSLAALAVTATALKARARTRYRQERLAEARRVAGLDAAGLDADFESLADGTEGTDRG
jgi:hypothetical protein